MRVTPIFPAAQATANQDLASDAADPGFAGMVENAMPNAGGASGKGQANGTRADNPAQTLPGKVDDAATADFTSVLSGQPPAGANTNTGASLQGNDDKAIANNTGAPSDTPDSTPTAKPDAVSPQPGHPDLAVKNQAAAISTPIAESDSAAGQIVARGEQHGAAVQDAPSNAPSLPAPTPETASPESVQATQPIAPAAIEAAQTALSWADAPRSVATDHGDKAIREAGENGGSKNGKVGNKGKTAPPTDDEKGSSPPDPTAAGVPAIAMQTATVVKAPLSPTAGIGNAKPRTAAEITSSAAAGDAAQASPNGTDDLPAPFASRAADNLPPLLASQAVASGTATPTSVRPGHSYGADTPAQAPQPVVAQPGRIGRDTGVEIARNVAAGRDEVSIRLTPAELGRIDIRLSFDDKGTLRATVRADSPAALDMLRRDAPDLSRSLANAGIASDASSFTFDSRNGASSQFAHQQQQQSPRSSMRGDGFTATADDGVDASAATYQSLRTSGRIDLMA